MKNKKTQMQTMKKVLDYIKKYSVYVVLSLLFAVATVAFTLYIPILTGDAVDLILGEGIVDFEGIYKILIQIIIVMLLTALAQWVMNICNNKITYGVIRDIRDKAFKKLEIVPLKYIDGNSHGDIVSRVIADVDQFADGLLMGFTQLFTGVITIFGTLCFMLSISIKITLVVVVITPVSLFVASFIAKRTYSMFQKQSETRGEQTALIDEMIGNQKVVQAYGQEAEVLEKFDKINNDL